MSMTYVSAELRRLVRERAKLCCEYCLMPESMAMVVHEMDHIFSEKHGGQTIADNLGLACPECNVFKGTDLTSIYWETGAITRLFHPRRDRWRDHFQLKDGWITGVTPEGRVTVNLLQLNLRERVNERRSLHALGLILEIAIE